MAEADKLKERNIALKVLLETHGQEKAQQVEKITRNFERLVLPYYEKLMHCHDKETRQTLLEIVQANTHACLSAEKQSHFPLYRGFTPMEVQVADLIKLGKTSKEIADLIHISPVASVIIRTADSSRLTVFLRILRTGNKRRKTSGA